MAKYSLQYLVFKCTKAGSSLNLWDEAINFPHTVHVQMIVYVMNRCSVLIIFALLLHHDASIIDFFVHFTILACLATTCIRRLRHELRTPHKEIQSQTLELQE